MSAQFSNGITGDISHTAAFTGRRSSNLPWGDDESSEGCVELKRRIRSAIICAYNEGKRLFLSGMASGFDVYAAEEVISLRDTLPGIELVCVFPYPFSDKRTSAIAEKSVFVHNVCEEYTSGCLHLRNRFLAENSSLLIACYDGRREGGTYQTIRLAEEKGKRIYLIRV